MRYEKNLETIWSMKNGKSKKVDDHTELTIKAVSGLAFNKRP